MNQIWHCIHTRNTRLPVLSTIISIVNISFQHILHICSTVTQTNKIPFMCYMQSLGIGRILYPLVNFKSLKVKIRLFQLSHILLSGSRRQNSIVNCMGESPMLLKKLVKRRISLLPV